MSEKEMWVPADRVAKIIRDWMEQWEKQNPTDHDSRRKNRGISAFCLLTGVDARKVRNILTGEQHDGHKYVPYLNVSFDVVDEMLIGMGRTDIWHVELADIYWGEGKKREVLLECDGCKTEKPKGKFKRIGQRGPLTTCRECQDAQLKIEVAA